MEFRFSMHIYKVLAANNSLSISLKKHTVQNENLIIGDDGKYDFDFGDFRVGCNG